MEQTTWDQALLQDLVDVMTDASICGLGQAASNRVRSVIRYFHMSWRPVNGTGPQR